MSVITRTCFCALLMFIVVSGVMRVEGRYLPTRSDNSRYEHIRDLLKALLEMNEGEAQNSRQNYPYDDVLRSKRDAFKQKSAAGSTFLA